MSKTETKTEMTEFRPDRGRIVSTRKRILDQIAWAGPNDRVTHEVIDEAISYCIKEAFKAGCALEMKKKNEEETIPDLTRLQDSGYRIDISFEQSGIKKWNCTIWNEEKEFSSAFQPTIMAAVIMAMEKMS